VKLRHHYFIMEQEGAEWDAIKRARNFAVHAPSELLNPEMELVILLPTAREG
jgi:type VI secretion system protein ImpJ